MLINLLFSGSGNILANLILFAFVAGALIISISVHEFAHAYVATKLGDLTAKSMGRVTLNPKAHLDPLGTAMLLIAGFGWGRPVPFNPYYLKNPKRDSALISFAGPGSNFLMAGFLSILYHVIPGGGLLSILSMFLYFVILYNLLLGFFNLIPLHPLDGFKVVNGFLPHDLSAQWMQMAPYGIYILLILVFTRSLSRVLEPLLSFAMRFLGLPR